MFENEKPSLVRYAAAFFCLAIMIAITLSPLQGLFWDVSVLLLLSISIIVAGASLPRSLAFVGIVLFAGLYILPRLLV